MKRLLLAAVVLVSASLCRAQDDQAAQADAYVSQALDSLAQGDSASALAFLDEAEPLADGAPATQIRLARAYAQISLPRKAAAVYMKAALDEKQPIAAALAQTELSRLADGLKLPTGYADLLRSGAYAQAVSEAPWWPAGYWALAMQAQIDERRADAYQDLRQFLVAMSASGLDGPYREWVIEAMQMKDQVGAIEATFLVDAGLLPSDWKDRVNGSAADMEQAFGAVDGDLWRVAGEAMRYTLRYKTLRVAQDGSGDYRGIQAAVDALAKSGGGGVIEVSPGDYDGAVVLREAQRLVLKASQPGTVRVTASGPALSVLGGSWLVVDGIAFVSSDGQRGADVSGAFGVTLRRCSFTGGVESGLRADDAEDLYLWDVGVRSPGTGAAFERATVSWVKGDVEASESGVESSDGSADLSYLQISDGRDGLAAWGRPGACGGKGGCPTASLRDSTLTRLSGTGVYAQSGAYVVVERSSIAAARAGVFGRGADLEVSKSNVSGPGALGVGVEGAGATAVVRSSVLRGVTVGLEALGTASLEADEDVVAQGSVGVQVVGSSVTISGTVISRQSEEGVLLTDPIDGWSMRDGEVDGSLAAVVLAGSGGSPSGCEAAGGRIERTLFKVDGKGLVAGPSSSRQGGAVCLRQDTFAFAQLGVWAVASGPRVLLDRSILAYGGEGLLDPARLVDVSASDAFENWAGDEEPADVRHAGLSHDDPLFLDPAGDDWRLGEGSPARGAGAFPD